MNPARWQQFAAAYGPAVLKALEELGPHLATGQTLRQHALDYTASLLRSIERYGLKSVEYYVINNVFGAYTATCTALGIENTIRAMENFLEGK